MDKKVLDNLKKEHFVIIGTCDIKNVPNVSHKLVLEAQDNLIYLIDQMKGETFKNIKVNPNISLLTVDTERQLAYRINGVAELIEEGEDYDKFLEKIDKRKTKLTTLRVIEGVRRGKKHKKFELAKLKPAAIIKTKVKKVSKISFSGKHEETEL
jgi:uncharacterized pyridoxamine 5'-phosphate oxidase family protein